MKTTQYKNLHSRNHTGLFRRRKIDGLFALSLTFILIAMFISSPLALEAGHQRDTLSNPNITGLQNTIAITHTSFLPLIMYPALQGHSVLFVSDRAETGKYDLYTMNIDGSNTTRLTQRHLDSYAGFSYDFLPQWSPDGTKIAVQMEGALYLLDPDGSNLQPLFDDPMMDVQGVPKWSPDGTKIAYIVAQCSDEPRPNCTIYGSDRSGLQVFDVQTKNITVLIDNRFLDSYAGIHWAPNGASLITVPRHSPSGAFISFLDGSPQVDILDNYFIDRLEIAPNGQRLLFITDTGNWLFTSDLDGDNVQHIFGDTQTIAIGATWHPDSTKIAYVSARYTGANQMINVVNTDGNNTYELTAHDNGSFKQLLGWTSDGAQVLYMSDVNRDYKYLDIYKINTDGSNPVNLTPDSPSDDKASDYFP